MADAFKSLAGIFTGKNAGPIISGTSLGLGEIGNLLAGNAQSKQADALTAQEKKISSLTPAQMTQMVTSAEKPIDNALVQNVTNTVQGDMASRGLSEAPGIFAAGESQALAPYAQQNYQTALEQTMKQLGLPLEYANTIKQFMPGQQSMTPALQLFLQQLSRLKGANANNPSPTTPPIFGDTSGSGGVGGSGGSGVNDALNGLLNSQAG